MAFEVGAAIARFKGDITDLKKGVAESKTAISGMKDEAIKMGDSVKASFDGFMGAVKLGAAVGAGAFVLFAKDSSQAAQEYEKSMISLGIIAERFGVKSATATAEAKKLGTELRIGTGPAAESLQNLLKSGLSLPQATDLMKRFTNEAMTGKSQSISLAQAVQNLSFAYTTGNSALGNMSGISENFSDIEKKGTEILLKKGKAASEITAEMARYEGLIAITNLTMGSSAKFVGTYADNMAVLELKVQELKVAFGQGLNKVLNEFVKFILQTGAIENFSRFLQVMLNGFNLFAGLLKGEDLTAELREWVSYFTGGDMPDENSPIIQFILGFINGVKALGQWISENKELVIGFLKGLAIAVAALAIIGTVAGLIALLTNPITILIAAIAALYAAWSTNFLGIKDLTDSVVKFLMAIFGVFAADWKKNHDTYMQILTGAWNFIVGFLKVTFALIGGIFTIFTAILTGDWKTAGEKLKGTATAVWEGLKQMFGGAFDFIIGLAKNFVGGFFNQLNELWNKAKEIGQKIKDALSQISPFHKSSPSLVEYVQKGTAMIEGMYTGLADNLNGMDYKSGIMGMAPSIATGGAGNAMASSGGGGKVINLEQNNQINSGIDADTVLEKTGFQLRSL